ncbi:Zf-FLZ domain [Dillenia turbinata]|uniref:Zf-FLZ domain n=1 Tax=Dillenia turbinata TaxID=194707 RepID=A0AAN8V5V5_9MAGN
MFLGKRRRPEIKRTMSMSGGMTVDLSGDHQEESGPSDHPQNIMIDENNNMSMGYYGLGLRQSGYEQNLSPRNYRRNSGDFIETAHFLRVCGLCKRRLAPGRDIYMYRGDTAFCSVECRERQMKQDEKKDKSLIAAASKSKKEHDNESSSSSSSTSEASVSKSETVSAA